MPCGDSPNRASGCAPKNFGLVIKIGVSKIPAAVPVATIMLSDATLAVLRKRLAGETVEITAETRPLFRELVDAGLMIPLHTFALGPESAYRLSDGACDLGDGIS
jgi:hypothetical protein